MKAKLRSIYRSTALKHPAIGNIIRRIYYRIRITTFKKKIVGKGNKITYGNSFLSSVIFDIEGNENHICIADGCVLNNVVFYIRGNNHRIQIGEGCTFTRGGSLWFEDYDGCLIIGENSCFEDVHIAVTEPNSKVQIGKDCLFAYDIDIRTGDSHSVIDSNSGVRINFAKDINIGNHIWIAAHCIILKGVSVADDSVIGTGSVVVRGFEEKGVVIAGNPAKIVKHNITWSLERIYKPS